MTSHQLEYPLHVCIKPSPALVWWQISSEAAPEVTKYEHKRSSGHLDSHRCKQICVTSVHSCSNYQILIIAHSLIYREEMIQLKMYQTIMRGTQIRQKAYVSYYKYLLVKCIKIKYWHEKMYLIKKQVIHYL